MFTTPFSFLRCARTWAVLAFGSTALVAKAAPRVVQTQFPTEDYVIASVVVTQAPYSALPDGHSDCTKAVQTAIDTVAGQGGGIVYLPSGRYRFDGNLVLKEGVTLRGDWKAPGKIASVGGTVLMPIAGKGQAEGTPFISMYRGTGVSHLSVWYPEQSVASPSPYPWTLADDPKHTGNNFTIQQVTLVNSYQGIKFGPEYNELFTVRHVYGTPLKTGLQFDSVTDIGRIIDLHFGPRYWSESGLGQKPNAAALNRYLLGNGTALEMRRSDWQYFYDVTVHGYSRGLYIRKGERGGSIGVASRLRVTGCNVGLLVDETRFVATQCRFEGHQGAVVTTGGFTDDLQLNNCDLVSDRGPALRHGGSGGVRLVNSRLTGISPSVRAELGQVALLNCVVPGQGAQVKLARPVERALLIGNRFSEASRALQNGSRGDVQFDGKPLDSPRVVIPTLPSPRDPRPARNQLFNVLDFGAQAGKADTTFDNSQAFQAALDAAGKAKGGTVFVPGGFYRINGHLKVPTGVELRGVFDVPHHTISLGSVLMPTEGRGSENGPAFLSLSPKSGLRGLTIWYPEQYTNEITPYPWTVRSLGVGCWMMDVTSANSYNFVDFGSYPSDGHLLRYVAGSPLRRGIWVSKGSGVVDSCQFNPHYWLRRTDAAPPLTRQPTDANIGDTVMDFVMKNHEAFIFGHCPREVQVNNFVYGAGYGLRFVNDGGATSGWIVNHASDGCSEGVTVDAAGAQGLNIISTQIAVVGKFKRRAVYIGAKNTGPVNLVGGYSFGQSDVPTMELYGSGPTLVQSWHSKQSEMLVKGGPKRIESAAFALSLPVAIKLTGPVSRLQLIGDTSPTDVGFRYAPAQKTVAARTNGKPLPPTPLIARFSTRFGDNDPRTNIVPITLKDMTNPQCRVEASAGQKGPGLVLSGQPDPQSQSLAYYGIYDVNIPIKPDTVLRYYWRSDSASGAYTGVDLVMTDGTTLRDSGAVDSNGRNMHPAAAKGASGYWWKIEGRIGDKLAGKTIKTILFAFDQRGATVPVRAVVDRIEIGEPKP